MIHIMKLLVINPGSTSTKISVFEDGNELFTQSVFHDAPTLMQYETTNDQLPFREKVVMDFLAERNMKIEDIDVFVGRGGCAASQPEGVMEIDERLYRDTMDDVGGSDHPAKLGVMMAYIFSIRYGKPAYTVNPTNVDELCDYARVTGLKGVYRRAQSHVLNQKGIARIHARKLGKDYKDCFFIVCHIDGGITIAAHKGGKMIDGTEGAGGDGPFTPTRIGSIPIMETARFLEEHTTAELEAMCSRSGGFVSHFGTSDSNRIHRRVEDGDEHATLIWDSMIYQICKEIGAMATVLEGHVDAILLTGGLVRFDDISEKIEKRCGWIAPIAKYQGEVEQEEMANEVMKVLNGEAKTRKYTAKAVFQGYPWDSKD